MAVFFIVIFLIFSIFFVFIGKQKRVVLIGKKIFIAERAITKEEQAFGLGGRKKLCASCAMLFEFKKKDKYVFWMKNMKFNLDIIWIADGKIVYMEKNVSRNSDKKLIPSVEADKVFEINSGLSDEYGFRAGDRVKIY